MKRAAKSTPKKRGRGTAAGAVVVLSRQQLEIRAEQIARDLLNVGRARAFQMLRTGKLRGTLAEAALTPIRDMLAR